MVRFVPLNTKRICGFTLIELMIVVAIIGILAAIAYPSFRDQVIKTHRTDGKDALMRAASLQQRWFTENNSFTSNITDIGGAASPESYYVLSVAIGDISGTTCNTGTHTNDNCFTLTATPQPPQNEDVCGNLVLDSFGRKTVSGTDYRCW